MLQIAKLVRDPREEVRLLAAYALGFIGKSDKNNEAIRRYLFDLRSDHSLQVRNEAARCLRELGDCLDIDLLDEDDQDLDDQGYGDKQLVEETITDVRLMSYEVGSDGELRPYKYDTLEENLEVFYCDICRSIFLFDGELKACPKCHSETLDFIEGPVIFEECVQVINDDGLEIYECPACGREGTIYDFEDSNCPDCGTELSLKYDGWHSILLSRIVPIISQGQQDGRDRHYLLPITNRLSSDTDISVRSLAVEVAYYLSLDGVYNEVVFEKLQSLLLDKASYVKEAAARALQVLMGLKKARPEAYEILSLIMDPLNEDIMSEATEALKKALET